MKLLILNILLAAAGIAYAADTYGRYTLVGSYVTSAEDEGVEGIYFQTVAEQGKTAAAYAVVGGVYPLRASSVSGNIVIPETLEGVPVRKIADGAFTAQTSLKSVTLPANLREIGDRAFGYCIGLTNVTFAGSGLVSVGECCFSNCVSLASVEFPASLSYVAPNAFALCDSLETVTFSGNAPKLDPPSRDTQLSYFGEKRWTSGTAPARAVFRVKTGTYGWKGPYQVGVPERWPLSHGFMNAHPVVSWSATSSGLAIRIAVD